MNPTNVERYMKAALDAVAHDEEGLAALFLATYALSKARGLHAPTLAAEACDASGDRLRESVHETVAAMAADTVARANGTTAPGGEA